MTATEVSRRFSATLSRVSRGEEIEILRNDTPVARLTPATDELVPASRWREIIARAPAVDDDFAGDLERVRESIGPPAGAWPT